MASFSGSTKREVLKNFENVVQRTLPVDKVAQYYKQCPSTAKEVVLNYVTYFEERIVGNFCERLWVKTGGSQA